jgi:hypothetical protein
MLAIAVLVGILDLFVEPKTSMLFGDARQSLFFGGKVTRICASIPFSDRYGRTFYK